MRILKYGCTKYSKTYFFRLKLTYSSLIKPEKTVHDLQKIRLIVQSVSKIKISYKPNFKIIPQTLKLLFLEAINIPLHHWFVIKAQLNVL